MKTTPAPDAKAAPIGHLGIGTPRVPTIEYFPNETISEFIARQGGTPGNRRQVAAWLKCEEPLT